MRKWNLLWIGSISITWNVYLGVAHIWICRRSSQFVSTVNARLKIHRRSMTALLVGHKVHIYDLEEYGFAANEAKPNRKWKKDSTLVLCVRYTKSTLFGSRCLSKALNKVNWSNLPFFCWVGMLVILLAAHVASGIILCTDYNRLH